jgi:predicted lipoprotein
MSRPRSRYGVRIGLAALAVAGVLAVVRPWTIVPIESAPTRTFDAERYVNDIWDARALPAAERSAVELEAFMQGPGAASGGTAPRAVFVKGRAVVAEIDRRSRVGQARLILPWAKAGQSAALQIGPVFRGTAVRDALDFIRFTDFVNQLEFAAVSNALNARVERVLQSVELDGLAGREVTFVGAVSTANPAVLDIVPVRLQVTGGAR